MLNGSKGASKPSQGQKKRARKAKRRRCGYLPLTKSDAAAFLDGTPDSTVEGETSSLPTTAVTDNALRTATGKRPELHRLTHSLSYQIQKVNNKLSHILNEQQSSRNKCKDQGKGRGKGRSKVRGKGRGKGRVKGCGKGVGRGKGFGKGKGFGRGKGFDLRGNKAWRHA